jgi:iron complex transport system substrate-binding protein
MSHPVTSRLFKAALVLTAVCAFGPQQALSLGIESAQTFRDSRGQRITVGQGGFSRIVSLYGAHTQNLITLGAAARVVGKSKQDELNVPVFTVFDGVEKYLAARVDLVLTRPAQFDGKELLFKRLRELGITVVALNPEHFSDLDNYFRILAMLVDQKVRGEKMIDCLAREIKALENFTAHLSPRKKAYFESQHRTYRTFTPDSLPLFVLKLAGGENIATDAAPLTHSIIAGYGKEKILIQGDKIDVFFSQSGPMNAVSREAIMEDAGFRAIKAVKTGSVHVVDEALVARPTLALTTGAKLLGTLMYPDLFKGYRPTCSETIFTEKTQGKTKATAGSPKEARSPAPSPLPTAAAPINSHRKGK